MNRLKALNNELISFVADSVDTLLAILGFLASYPATFILIPITIGSFVRKNFVEGFVFLILTTIVFYLGKGIQRYLERREK